MHEAAAVQQAFSTSSLHTAYTEDVPHTHTVPLEKRTSSSDVITETLLDPECMLAKYSIHLKKAIMDMNATHISCPYKPVFAQHAIETLLMCDQQMYDSWDTQTVTGHQKTHNTETPADTQHSDESSESEEENVHSLCPDCILLDRCNVKQKTPQVTTTEQDSTMKVLFKKLHNSASSNTKCQLEMSAWKVCNICCGFTDLSCKYIKETRKNRKTKQPQRQRSAHAENKPENKPCWNRAQSGNRQTRSLETMTQKRSKDKLSSSENQGSSTSSTALSKKRQIQYKFKHGISREEHIKSYRESYTHLGLRLGPPWSPNMPFPPEIPPTLVIKETPPMAKVYVECKDVRDGAIIKPVKPSQFTFDIVKGFNPATLRTPSKFVKAVTFKDIKGLNNESPSPGVTPGGTPVPGTPTQTDEEEKHTSPPNTPSPVNIPYIPKKAENVGGSVVCRSRPSIPSNARGIICATAIETTKHLVTGARVDKPEPIGRQSPALQRSSPRSGTPSNATSTNSATSMKDLRSNLPRNQSPRPTKKKSTKSANSYKNDAFNTLYFEKNILLKSEGTFDRNMKQVSKR